MVILCLMFWGTTKLFSKAVAALYILTSAVSEFRFLYILSNAFFVCFFHYSHPGRLKWYHLVLVCISPMAKMSSIFCLFTGQSYIFFGEMCLIYSNPLGFGCLLVTSYKKSWDVLDTNPLSGKLFANIFLPFLELLFHFLDYITCSTEVLNFNVQATGFIGIVKTVLWGGRGEFSCLRNWWVFQSRQSGRSSLSTSGLALLLLFSPM